MRTADLPVLIMVWILCVGTDWSTGTKIALNVGAVLVLCAKEVLVHLYLTANRRQQAPSRRAAARQLMPAA